MVFYFILFICYFSHSFLSNTCLGFHKANSSEKLYIQIAANLTQREFKNIVVNRLSIEEAG